MRADARRNRARLLAAARQAFVADGPSAPLDTIARRADVGIATLYRHFPDRTTLLLAVVSDVMAGAAAEATRALAEEADAFTALRRYMHRTLDLGVASLMPQLGDDVRRHPEVEPLLDETAAAQRRLIELAQRQGTLRPDVDFADIGLALSRFARPIGGSFDPALEASVAHRHLEVFIDGLRDTSAAPLPGPALSLRRLRAMQRRPAR